jgi:hypothetical protein
MSGSPCGGCTMRSAPTQTPIYAPGMLPPHEYDQPKPMAVCQHATSDNYGRRCSNIRSCEDRKSSIYPSERARVLPARLP